MFRGEPYPPTPWMEMLQVKHKIQNIEMLKKKGLNWIAWSQADWQGLSGNRTSSVSSLLTKFMNTSELLHLMMKLSAGSFAQHFFVKAL